jgi:hypothetical protein
MDYDRNQFFQDIFERLVKLPGDPMRQFSRAVEDEIEYMVKDLKAEANSQRDAILTMAEQRKANPHKLVDTLWKSAGSTDYDRRR